MNWFEACKCGSGMPAPASNLISAIDDPPVSSRQSIFSEMPASDFARQGMSLLCSSTSSTLGIPAGIGGTVFFSAIVISTCFAASVRRRECSLVRGRRRQPRRHQPLAQADQRIDEYPEHGQGEQGGERERRIELRGGALQEKAKSLARAYEFADHRPDHRQGNGDLGAGDHERKRRRKLHFEEDLQRR